MSSMVYVKSFHASLQWLLSVYASVVTAKTPRSVCPASVVIWTFYVSVVNYQRPSDREFLGSNGMKYALVLLLLHKAKY